MLHIGEFLLDSAKVGFCGEKFNFLKFPTITGFFFSLNSESL